MRTRKRNDEIEEVGNVASNMCFIALAPGDATVMSNRYRQLTLQKEFNLFFPFSCCHTFAGGVLADVVQELVEQAAGRVGRVVCRDGEACMYIDEGGDDEAEALGDELLGVDGQGGVLGKHGLDGSQPTLQQSLQRLQRVWSGGEL